MDGMSVHHITNSPHYHQSNGLAETYVQLVKSLLYKVKESDEDPYFALLLYRNTPLFMTCLPLLNCCVPTQVRSDLPMLHGARIQVKQAVTK